MKLMNVLVMSGMVLSSVAQAGSTISTRDAGRKLCDNLVKNVVSVVALARPGDANSLGKLANYAGTSINEVASTKPEIYTYTLTVCSDAACSDATSTYQAEVYVNLPGNCAVNSVTETDSE